MAKYICVNVHSTNVNSENISRQNLIKWVNDVLGTSYKKIEDLCKGDAYCKSMDMIFPGCLPIKKVRVDPNQEFEFIQNFKFVQAAFKKVGCDKDVPIGRLVKGKFQDNLEFLQWFHKFFLANYYQQEHQDGAVFEHAKTFEASPVKTTAGSSKTPGRNTTFDKKQNLVSQDHGLDLKSGELEKQVTNLKLNLSAVEKERNFYYDKLHRIEIFCGVGPDDEFKQSLLRILYADKEASDGEPDDSLGECY